VTYRARVRQAAKLDIAESADYYEGERLGLGRRFVVAALDAIDEATRFPEKHRVAVDPVRLVLLQRFPFGVFFVVRGEFVVVLAVQDLRRSERRIEDVIQRRVDGDES
jgi:toxin ParE1/3/4